MSSPSWAEQRANSRWPSRCSCSALWSGGVRNHISCEQNYKTAPLPEQGRPCSRAGRPASHQGPWPHGAAALALWMNEAADWGYSLDTAGRNLLVAYPSLFPVAVRLSEVEPHRPPCDPPKGTLSAGAFPTGGGLWAQGSAPGVLCRQLQPSLTLVVLSVLVSEVLGCFGLTPCFKVLLHGVLSVNSC